MPRPALTTTQRRLVGTVAAGAVLIAAIGFVGSYAAVRQLAEAKGFGDFATAFPIGIDIGIVILLALDLLLAWLRMPYPLLRHTAWLLTAATIAFNGAAAWPDPLGTAMHAVIPVLFVVVVEAARNAVGRIADITAEKHMDGVRLSRWLLSPVPTFRLWRRMKLWELRSYEQVIHLEQERLIYQAGLQAQYGRRWRWRAPVEDRLPLRLTRYGRALGTPAADTEPDPDDTFDLAADEAVALAPPAAVAALEAASPQSDPQHTATPVLAPVAAPATPATPPAPPNTVPAGVALLPVTCQPQRHTTSATPATPEPAATPPRPAAQHPATPVATAPGDRATATVAAARNTEPMTVAAVADFFGVSPGTVRSWVHRGHLKPLPRNSRNGRNTFDPADVAAFDIPSATASRPDHMEGGYA
ncbi:DUF2637 domain-containing protein [Streptomyces cyaneofuscatus]